MVPFPFERVENVGEGENASYKHFRLFPYCFQKIFSLGDITSPCVVSD